MRDTPISEATFCGAAVGAAIAGMRPIVEIQIFDFVTQMMDMIVNQAAKFRFMNGGVAKVPVVVRGPQGGGIRLAAQHSQSLEAWFAHVPGLVVVAPSNPYDAKGLLISAIRDDNPVMFLEHKMLYLSERGLVPESPTPSRSAERRQARRVRYHRRRHTSNGCEGPICRGRTEAGRHQRGSHRPAHDPAARRETILTSVRKTHRLVVAHEACRNGGFGAEVAARITERAFKDLHAPVFRVAARDTPMPFNDKLETAVIPSREAIMSAVRSVLTFS